MTVDEQELVLVLNRADAAEGFILASSTWPRWTRFLDKLVAAGLATVEDIRDREGRRTGGNYKINPGAIRIGRRRKRRACPQDARFSSRDALPEGVSTISPAEEEPGTAPTAEGIENAGGGTRI